MKTRKILLFLLVIAFIFCIFGLKEANAATEITKVDVYMSNPLAGNTIKDSSFAHISANDTITFEFLGMVWYKYNSSTGKYDWIEDTDTKLEENEKYAVWIEYKRPNEYTNSATITVNVNGNPIDVNNIDEFNAGSTGDENNEYDGVFYKIGSPRVKKEVEEINVSVISPKIGTIPNDWTQIAVTTKGNEGYDLFEKIEVTWWTLNEENVLEKLNTEFEENKVYMAMIEYIRPNEYIITDTTKIMVNGAEININNMDEFNQGSWGDLNNEYDGICYSFKELKKVNKIDINLPAPVIDQKISDKTNAKVTVNDTQTFEVLEIEWYVYNSLTQKYELIEGTEKFESNKKYAVELGYIRTGEYDLAEDVVITVNGKVINAKNIDEFNPGSSGYNDDEYDYVFYEFEELKVIEESKPEHEEDNIQQEDKVDGNINEEQNQQEDIIQEDNLQKVEKENISDNPTVTNNVKTGDNIIIYVAICAIAVIGLILSYRIKK